MSMSDPLGDMITRIRNAHMRGRAKTRIRGHAAGDADGFRLMPLR